MAARARASQGAAALLLAAALLAAGCTRSGTGVLLTLLADGVSADRLTVTARFDGLTISRDVPAAARPLDFPTSLVVALPDRATTVQLTVTALAAGTAVATAETAALAIEPHHIVPVTLLLIGPGGGSNDGGGGSGGDGGDGGATTASCGAPSLIADDFSGAATAAPWWQTFASGGVTATAAGGELTVALPAAAPAGAEGGYNSLAWYDFRSARVRVEVPQMVSTTVAAYAGLSLHRDDNTYLGMAQQAGMLGFEVVDSGTSTPVGSIPWDATAHRWWQLREAAGMVYFETSPDGGSWTVQAMTATPAWARTVRVVLGAGVDGAVNDAGAVKFAQLNQGLTADSPRCAMHTLSDDFADGSRGDVWLGSYSQRCGATESGILEFSPMAKPSGAEYISSYAYDLRGDALSVEVPMTPDAGGGTSAWLRAGLDETNGSGYEMVADSGNLVLQRRNADGSITVLSSQPFDAAKHRWWRLRESGGALVYETSGDGQTWLTWLSVATGAMPVAAVRVHLGLVVYGAATAPGVVQFARLDLPPL